MSKTISSRIDNRLHNKMLERCNQLGCTMNNFVKDAVEKKLNHYDSSSSNPFKNCTDCDENIHRAINSIIQNIHDNNSFGLVEDDDGRPLSAEIGWSYDDEGFPDKE